MQFVPRKLPTSEELVSQLLDDHRKNARPHKHRGILYDFCSQCLTSPRSLILAFEWVKSHEPFLRDLYEDLPVQLQNALADSPTETSGHNKDTALELGWYVREADHLEAAKSTPFISLAEKYVGGTDIYQLLDLTFLPRYDENDLKMAQYEEKSSANRPYASRLWQRRGLTSPGGELAAQGFWTSSGVPLAQWLRPMVNGRKWASYTKDSDPIPDALWSAILELWKARYPQKDLPSPSALRSRLSKHLPG